MERRLSDFFKSESSEYPDPLITGLEYDSRNVKPGNIFFALPGLHTDGSLYIDEAIKKGAPVIVCGREDFIKAPERKSLGAIFLYASNPRRDMSSIAAKFYGFPSQRLNVTGVTGTDGKSTTVYLIWQLLTMMGKKAGFINTVQYCSGGEVFWTSEHQTTPEATVVQRLLCEMADNGCEYAVIEASSHGLSQKTSRLGDVEFSSAVMTNVAHEHLEFHGSWEQYRDDKANLFRALDNYKSGRIEPFGVINADDKSSAFFAKTTKQKIYRFSAAGMDADIVMETIESSAWGNWYQTFVPALNERIDFRDKLPGAFNSRNVMAAALAVSKLLNLPLRDIAQLANKLKPVRGRMTAIDRGQPFELVVDYAHTPLSFQTIFPQLRERINKTSGRIITVFGSPGERDTQKRAEQGKIAAIYSDIIVLTDENPRAENSMDILEEIAGGIEEAQVLKEDKDRFRRDENLFFIPDRPAAIRKAVSLAKNGDLVLLLGKGLENTMIFADHAVPYDEIGEAEKALEEIGRRV